MAGERYPDLVNRVKSASRKDMATPYVKNEVDGIVEV